MSYLSGTRGAFTAALALAALLAGAAASTPAVADDDDNHHRSSGWREPWDHDDDDDRDDRRFRRRGSAPRIVLISLDGAKPDLIEKYLKWGVLPRDEGLGELRRRGVVALQNVTVTPSLTAVAHIAIATGSTAVNNDIPANTFHVVAAPLTRGGFQRQPQRLRRADRRLRHRSARPERSPDRGAHMGAIAERRQIRRDRDMARRVDGADIRINNALFRATTRLASPTSPSRSAPSGASVPSASSSRRPASPTPRLHSWRSWWPPGETRSAQSR